MEIPANLQHKLVIKLFSQALSGDVEVISERLRM